ncbi:TPA: hypothetical protein RPC40_004387 [Escherichia coli]|nr:hypothetical protein [Escherichia coli]
MKRMKMIYGITVRESNLIWCQDISLSLQENPRFGDFPECVTMDSFKIEKRILEDELLYQVFYLKERDFINIFAEFSIKEDSDLTDLYHELMTDGKNPDYFIAFRNFGE